MISPQNFLESLKSNGTVKELADPNIDWHLFFELVIYSAKFESKDRHLIIQTLIDNLPLSKWLNFPKIKKEINEIIKNHPRTVSDYSWFMNFSVIRQLFTPEEKGRFLHMGLAFNCYELAFYSTQDHDWKRNIDYVGILNTNHDTLAKNYFPNHPPEIFNQYVHWMITEIFPHVFEEQRHQWLVLALQEACIQLERSAALKAQHEIGLPCNYSPTEYDQLKKHIAHMKESLNVDYWDNENKNLLLTNLVSKKVGNRAMEKIMEKKVISNALIKKLDHELQNKPENKDIRLKL